MKTSFLGGFLGGVLVLALSLTFPLAPAFAQQEGSLRNEETVSSNPVEEIVITREFTLPLYNGCRYTAIVNGKVQHVGLMGEGSYSPNLKVSAFLTCPNVRTLHVSESTISGQKMSREELEQALDLRTSVISSASGRRCVYVPNFAFNGRDLMGGDVGYLCPAGGASQGGEQTPPPGQPPESPGMKHPGVPQPDTNALPPQSKQQGL